MFMVMFYEKAISYTYFLMNSFILKMQQAIYQGKQSDKLDKRFPPFSLST